MDFTETARAAIRKLLNTLRTGDIWDWERKEVREYIGLSSASRTVEEEVLSMRLRSLVAELSDRRGWWDVAPYALENIGSVKRRFKSETALSEPHTERWRWLRQAGWLLLQDARCEHRRSDGKGINSAERHKLAAQDALRSAKELQSHLTTVLPEQENHELLYRVAFSIARHLQVLGPYDPPSYDEAEGELVTALHHCYCHRQEVDLMMRELEADNPQRHEEMEDLIAKQDFTMFNTTVVVANLGRINVERGSLKRAIPQLLIARTMLLGSKDRVMRGFVELQLGSVYRQLGASTDASDMPDPTKLLGLAVDLFRDAGHRQLEARARLELAQHFYGLASVALQPRSYLEKAEQLLHEEPKQTLHSTDHVERWDAQRLLLLARIEHLKPGHDAETVRRYAEEALHLSKVVGRKELEAIAGLALAELCIDEEKYADAIRYCEIVERVAPADIADQAWLIIVLANAWLKQGDRATAETYLKRWKEMRDSVQNVYIRNKATSLERHLETQRCFYVRPDGNLNYERLHEELKMFLIQAAQPLGGLDVQADLLGLKKNSLARWRSSLIKKNKLKSGRPPRSRRGRPKKSEG